MRARLRRLGRPAALGAAILLVAMLLVGARPTPTAEERLSSRLASAPFPNPVFPDYFLLSERPVEVRTPDSVRSNWTTDESASWATGYRTCRKPWPALVATAGLSEWIPGSRPKSKGQLEWLAWKLLYLEKLSLPDGTLQSNFAVEGCIDGFNSVTRAPAARGGVDAAP